MLQHLQEAISKALDYGYESGTCGAVTRTIARLKVQCIHLCHAYLKRQLELEVERGG
jgi:hypothetical protein